MKRIFLSLMLLTALAFPVQAQQTVKVSQNGLETTMSNGIISLTIGTNGRINTLTVDGSENLIGSTGIYFDHTRKGIGNKPLSPSKAEIISHTDDYAEVLYTNTSYHPQFKQGFILRRGISGIYTYILGYGDSQSGDIQVQEMRVCTRLNENFLNGYVDDRMQGRLPASAVIAACEADGKNNPAYVQDATYRLDDGTVYTKYDWAQLCVRDSLHGLMSDGIGVWNIPCSYEWMPGGPTKQELTVHATKVSPITIQMLQGEHFGTSALVLDEGDSKIWGPVFIYINKGTREEMIADAKREAHEQQQAWPFDWFKNALYPLDCSTVTGRINVTTGQRCDSIQVVLAQPDAHLFDQNKGYLFWALTDSEGRFSIPKVRRGTYALRAYATAGDVTDELQVRDINVDTDLTDLGTIEWRPDCYETQLWRIGKSDRLCEEFRLGEGLRAYGLWKQVPADLTYWPDTKVPGTEQKNWWYAQTQKGTWTVVFDCDRTYTGDVHFTAAVAGASRTPTVTVAVNGTTAATWKFPFNDAGIYRSSHVAGRYSLRTCTFPASRLKVGQNKLTLSYSGGDGSGVMWDCLKLEAGDAITDNITSIPGESGLRGICYDMQGRRVAAPTRSGIHIRDGKPFMIK